MQVLNTLSKTRQANATVSITIRTSLDADSSPFLSRSYRNFGGIPWRSERQYDKGRACHYIGTQIQMPTTTGFILLHPKTKYAIPKCSTLVARHCFTSSNLPRRPFTQKTKHSWQEVFGVVSSGMMEGICLIDEEDEAEGLVNTITQLASQSGGGKSTAKLDKFAAHTRRMKAATVGANSQLARRT